MKRKAIVDLGSNTARLVVYSYEPGTWFRLDDNIREPVRLAEGFGRSATLSPAAIERAVAALKLFADYAAVTGLDGVEVLGTSALREAANREQVLSAAHFLGFTVRILEGAEEAELGVDAVANSFDLPDAWVVDLGGGSLQMSRMAGRRFVAGQAYPLGMVRLTESCLVSDPPKRPEVKALEDVLEEHLGPACDDCQGDDFPLVAMGGTVRNLARAVQKKKVYPLDLLHGYRLDLADLELLTERLLSLPTARRAGVPGIRPYRADVIAAGAVTFRWLLRRCRRDHLIISGEGLREGVLYRHLLPAPHRVDDVGRFSVRRLLARYPQPEVHTRKVRELAANLFQGLQPLHGLGDRDLRLLDAAACLHDVGMAIDYYHHHKHGAYLLGTEPLCGFSHREQALLIQMVRYHRKGVPKAGPFKTLLDKDDEQRLLHLTTCLRLAEYLERSRAGRIKELGVVVGDEQVLVTLYASQDPTVELWETRKHAPLFRAAFDRRLTLRALTA